MVIPRPIALVILDGWGEREHDEKNAIAHAHPTTFLSLQKRYPHTILNASGSAVGLPDGALGGSEVGHFTIGAGRPVEQAYFIINKTIAEGAFGENPPLNTVLKKIAKSGARLHLIGLLSDGGIHSHESHLYALIKEAARHGIEDVFIHAFLDGRDTPPHSAQKYLAHLDEIQTQYQIGALATISGRFYAMDRDNNWDRIEAAYSIMTGKRKFADQLAPPISDEFVAPHLINQNGVIKEGDALLFFNFRADRMRQLFSRFWKNEQQYHSILSMTRYDHSFNNEVLFEEHDLKETISSVLAAQQISRFTTAETEKFAHVTYFFSGSHAAESGANPYEQQVMIPSIKVASYRDQPAMSAAKITRVLLQSLKTNPCQFYLANYANPDMVGHSGDFDATVAAIKCVDEQLAPLFHEIVEVQNGLLCITSDHGNADDMGTKNEPRTAHSLAPVPFIAAGNWALPPLPQKSIASIASFLLGALQIEPPDVMK